MDNPYSPPIANVERLPAIGTEELAQLEKIRSGQRLVVWAMLLYFGLGALSVLVGEGTSLVAIITMTVLGLAFLIAMIALALIGLLRIWSGLGTAVIFRILLFLLLFVPLVGLLVLASSSARATKRLRANGYRVGLLGAGPRT